MRLSDAMLAGFALVGGRQCKGKHYRGGTAERPDAVCASGAILLGATGIAKPQDAPMNHALLPSYTRFAYDYGITLSDANDKGMPWEDLYGMARAAGL